MFVILTLLVHFAAAAAAARLQGLSWVSLLPLLALSRDKKNSLILLL
jgi:2-methylcitrate dehydratase PrpD